jgi:hypothetical protein
MAKKELRKRRAKRAAGKQAVRRSRVSASAPASLGMMSKEEFIKSCAHEARCIKHIASKIPDDQFEYKPTPVQRNMTELLRYLACCASSPLCNMRDGNWDAAEAVEREVETLDVRKDFAAAIDRQQEFIASTINAFEDSDFAKVGREMPWGAPCKLGQGLINTVLKPLVAYRMQLFLYVKASGRHDLGPAQCWVGVDPKPQPAQG